MIAVKEGDTLDGGYRVAAVTAAHVELVYVPLGVTQRVPATSTLQGEAGSVPVALAPVALAPVALAASPSAAERLHAAAAPAQLRWDGPERVRVGADFTVALRVTYDQPLRAAPMQLRFEPGILEARSVRPGKFLGQGSFSYRVNPEGSIFIGATSAGVAPGADAELLVVTFRPIKVGATAELNMTSLSLQGAAGRSVAHAQVAAFRAPIIQ